MEIDMDTDQRPELDEVDDAIAHAVMKALSRGIDHVAEDADKERAIGEALADKDMLKRIARRTIRKLYKSGYQITAVQDPAQDV